MKAKIPLFLLTAVSFGFLFQSGHYGFNVFLITSVLIIYFVLSAFPAVFAAKYWIPAWGLSAWQAVFPTPQGMVVVLLLWGLTAARMHIHEISTAGGLLNTVVCYLVSPFLPVIDFIHKGREKTVSFRPPVPGAVLAVISLICIVFIVLYYFSNPLFANAINQIQLLDFIDKYFLLSFAVGALLVCPAFYFYPVEQIHALDQHGGKISREMVEKKNYRISLTTEFYIVSGTMISLSVILFGMNMIDLYALVRGVLPEGVSHSEFLHQGFYTLVVSVFLSAMLTWYFFRGRMNFLPRSGMLRLLCHTWMGLNIMLVCITAWKNLNYIHEYGLTHRRMLVGLGLLVSFAALVLTMIKIQRHHTGYHALQRIVSTVLVCCFLSSLFSWNRVITWYNLRYSSAPDIAYLLQLAPQNLDLLHHYSLQYPDEFSGYHSDLETAITNFKEKQQQKDWRGYNYMDDLIDKEF